MTKITVAGMQIGMIYSAGSIEVQKAEAHDLTGQIDNEDATMGIYL